MMHFFFLEILILFGCPSEASLHCYSYRKVVKVVNKTYIYLISLHIIIKFKQDIKVFKKHTTYLVLSMYNVHVTCT